MNRSKIIWALAGLNVALAGALAWKLTPENTAHAQARPAARGEYMLVPAKASGLTNGMVYIIDTRNLQLSAIAYDDNKKEIQAMEPLNLQRFFDDPSLNTGGKMPRKKGG